MHGHAIYVHGHARNDDFPIDFALFTKALRTNGPTDGPTDQPTDGHTLHSAFLGFIQIPRNPEKIPRNPAKSQRPTIDIHHEWILFRIFRTLGINLLLWFLAASHGSLRGCISPSVPPPIRRLISPAVGPSVRLSVSNLFF